MPKSNGCTEVCYAETEFGKLMGYQCGDVYTFKGIPYASAKRFHLPEKPQKWEGIRKALVYGEKCPSNQTKMSVAAFVDFGDRDTVENEDCQFLNVWTKSLDEQAKRPVIVWLHGGGYGLGCGNELAGYDGHNIVEYGDVVFVSLNHRINILGYLDLSAYGEEYTYSGNVGQADIIMALQWVRDNIGKFGGDAGNVTIIGQSGGGGKVYALMGTPRARGLFHKAFVLSGDTDGVYRKEAQETTARLLEELGISPDEIKKLETIPYADLANAGKKIGFRAMPVIDGDFYPERTLKDGKFSGLCRDIPLIVSTTYGEMSSNLQRCLFLDYEEGHMAGWSAGTVEEKLREDFGDRAEEIKKEFREAYPLHDIRDVLFIHRRNNDQATAKYLQGGASVYQAVFAWKLPIFGGVTAWHTGGDVPFLFHNADRLSYVIAGAQEEAHRYQDACTNALLAFVYSGDPSTPELQWEPFTAGRGETMVFDSESRLRYYHDQKLMALLPPAKPLFAKFKGKIPMP